MELTLSNQCVLIPVKLDCSDQKNLVKMYELERLVIYDQSCGVLEGRVEEIRRNGTYNFTILDSANTKNKTKLTLNISSLIGVYQREAIKKT